MVKVKITYDQENSCMLDDHTREFNTQSEADAFIDGVQVGNEWECYAEVID